MLEWIINNSIQRRNAVVLVAVVLAAFGSFALSRLPIDAVPDITNNQIQVNTVQSSMSPIEMEKQVTFPIETALAGIPGLQQTRSLSRNGFSQVTAVFNDDVDIYFARQQVAERLAEARDHLPPETDPVMGPISTGLGEIYMWTVEYRHPHGRGAVPKDGAPGWQSDGAYLTPEGEFLRGDIEQASYLRTVQDWIIRPLLRNVRGVAGVDSIGGYVKQYQVQPDPRKLVAFGLTFRDLLEALEENNVSTGAGYIEHQGDAYTVRAAGRIEHLDEIAEIVIRERSGTPIRVRDVAWVGIGKELRTGSASKDGEEVVVGTVLMLIGENSRTVSEAVHARMMEIGRSLPPDIRVQPTVNRTALVDATITTVERNLIEGAVLVIVVLFLLLGNIRAAIITALAIPLSMLLTAIGMVQSRTSGNLMSLGAIDFGLIVDGAVIIVENSLRILAHRQRELGRTLSLPERLEATRDATKQVIVPAAYGTGIIIIVYIPILFLTGIEGKMFHPMAITVIFALLAAFLLSITLIPALVAIAIRGAVKESENVVMSQAKERYAPLLELALRFRRATIAIGVACMLLALVLFRFLGQEFVPTLSELDIALHAIRIPSTALTQSQHMQFSVERAVATVPEVDFVFSKTGTAEVASDPMPPNVSDTFIILKPRENWPTPHRSKEEVRFAVEEAVERVPGNNYEFTQPIQMRFNELIAGVRGDVAVKVFGDNMEALLPLASKIQTILSSLEGAADVRTEQVEGLPMLDIKVERSSLARYGLTAADVQDVVSIAVGGREAGVLFQGDRRFEIVVRLPENFRTDVTALENLPLPLPAHDEERANRDTVTEKLTADGEEMRSLNVVPLRSVATISRTEGANQVSRENGKRRIVVQANVRGRDIGGYVAEAQSIVEREIQLPAGSWIEWGGQFENLVAAKSRLALVVPVCFLLIFLLLYGSLGTGRDALLVFSGVPLALSGGVFALWISGMPFSISAAVGFIALSGVAVLNGLVLISFIKELWDQGVPLDRAVREGCVTRLRPVLMTALVASLGFLPMALATGTGAEVQRPIATVVIGGLFSSTILTLFVLPALYRTFAARGTHRSPG